MTNERKITVNALTRVEGEGALHIRVRGNAVESVKLSIYESPRFFESFLRGRAIEEVPDITARICGICPVAYQMTSVHAIEKALGIEISPGIRTLRRLLYCGEWIESHVLHIIMLNAPDFFDCHSGIELAERFPDRINDGLRIKKTGNQLLEVLGGRAIHPVNVRVGGFYKLPTRDELTVCLPDLKWALQAAIEMTRWVATFDFPEFNIDCELVALQHDDEYPMNEGVIASTRYPSISVDDYEHHFSEQHAAHSTALQSVRRDHQTPYFLGPLARLELNHARLFPNAQRLFKDVCPPLPMRNRFHSIIARSIEVVHALEEAIDIIESYEPPPQPFISYQPKASDGCAATEAPRGMIYHHYQIKEDGTVASSKIVPPTSQNQLQIESDLREYLPKLLGEPDEIVAAECEKLIRNYDPCISCSTHFLTLTMERT
ncbi:NAD-reducing hydrogenase HoxS subunit beta [Rubripirellula tenax]|uniref:NAD-reducing hydrogenase HoxS subunit beta n=1 Tax=Rubripirellula tenax TaxID=2528015 RepID=A0A5C6EQC4_9BACT|nr:Ni/Fe hydrogenase subunit alpha [Rubripirellula tenax]TWU50574.1 NAD-reducing hydrogenase HoxS subunit beta [Rubripirellula tenax]